MTQPDHSAEKASQSSLGRPPRSRWDYVAMVILATLVISTPFVLLSAVASWTNNNNDLIAWADDDLPIKQQFQAFVHDFGRPELIVVSWPDCRIDSDELAKLAAAVSGEPGDWFVNVTTTATVLQELKEVPGGLTEDEIRKQLAGILVGVDGELACLVAELGATGRDQRVLALARLKQLSLESGISEEEVKIGGMGAELAWLDDESISAPARIAPVIGLLMSVLCMIFLRSVRLGLFVSTLGGFTGILSAALVHWCGVQSNAILATQPTLGGLLTISLSLHFVGYYQSAVQKIASPREALQQAFRWAWKPTLISGVTTALGLGSLSLSRTVTIQQFGLFGALVTICAAILTLTALPAFIWLMGTRIVKPEGGLEQRLWSSWGRLVQANSRTIVIVVSVVACIVGAGLVKLETGVHIDSLFAESHEIIQVDRWLEENIGPLSTLEVVVSFPLEPSESGVEADSKSPSKNPAAHLETVQSLTTHLRESDKFGSLVSAATGLPIMEEIHGMRRVAASARLRKWLNDHRDELLSSGLYVETSEEQRWRISIRIPTITDEPTNDLREQLETEIESWRTQYLAAREESSASFGYFVTGLPMLFEQIEHQFIEDLLITYVGGLVLISITVFIVLRNFGDAVTAMVPNVLPAVGVLGGLSILGVELDVGSVMTASIALGVAVDDTLHFILWYQQQRKNDATPDDALRSSIRHCGSPILQTSVICGVGLAALGVAPFLPTARFGTLIASMLCVALVGDLLFLPAMLSLRGRRRAARATDSQMLNDQN